MSDCLFCKIIHGEIPTTKVYAVSYTHLAHAAAALPREAAKVRAAAELCEARCV